MKTVSLSLEDFDLGEPGGPGQDGAVGLEQREAERLLAFENGYKAGWDDSTNTIAADESKISSALKANLSDLSFTYHEARVHVLKGVEGFVKSAVEGVLPKIARTALPELIWEQMSSLAHEASSQPITLLVAPKNREVLEGLLPEDLGFPVVIKEETTLVGDQIFVKVGAEEKAVDMTTAIFEIDTAVREFFAGFEQEALKAHG
ncbi:flagellar biosynthesis protein [Meridianimarinicoccus roseus]|uniref:Flagellar biosynthesis protein n=1 Tax=Meridianimarinicoccus roseus TaxID=2072018 RepID=A0A2V2LIE5_9RHOB|nr:flagellar biosynthesis protein [Meridianimarinicoccus roseus]PWR02189.1 flagellar biosynthesis protein [Meridianimarinicoccus roseus]